MSYIESDNKDYGIRALERKISRLKVKKEQLKGKDLYKYGYIELGRIEEAIYIYEDLLDLWNEL